MKKLQPQPQKLFSTQSAAAFYPQHQQKDISYDKSADIQKHIFNYHSIYQMCIEGQIKDSLTCYYFILF